MNDDVGVSASQTGPSQAEPVVSALRASVPDAEWRNTKAQRAALREMFNGRCAYCGGELDKMHADHVEPCVRVTRDPWGRPLPVSECYMVKPERNTVGNMMPACAACNLHKGGYALEGWRNIIQRSAAICRRDTSTFKVGERFGIIVVHEKPVEFFFEKHLTRQNEADPHP
jgi:5-methylcytosine-specific restriction endonuclease McrA